MGNAQDAGVPQAGCFCPRCKKARQNRAFERYAACLGLVDHREKACWLVDATPDLRSQLADLQGLFPGYKFGGVALTHAHAGHYPGLVHFGPEGWNLKGLPLYLSEGMAGFLQANQPWASLLNAHFISRILEPGVRIALSEGLLLEPVWVPHRPDFTDTLAFKFTTSERSLFYCPDIDSWEHFDLAGTLEGVDFALLDGTFYSAWELPGRDLTKIPHPLATQTAEALRGLETQTWLVHLNHSNPLHEEGPEREILLGHGLRVGEQGQRWKLAG